MNRREVLLAGGAVATGTTAGCTGSDESPRTLIGIFPGEEPDRIRPFQRWLGEQFAVTTLYVDAFVDARRRQRIVFERMREVWDGGRVPMLTWQPFPRAGTPDDERVTRAIVDGEYDETIAGWARDLRDWLDVDDDRMVYFRPFPEMNGDWVPWGADATTIDDFVGSWRHVYETFKDARFTGERVAWIWNPNATEHGRHDTESYYPGDDYVDWLGLDGYNFGDSQEWSSWRAPGEVFDPMLSRLEALSDKPICLPEFGSSSLRGGEYDPAAKSEWIEAVYELVDRRDVRMTCWFNVDKETDWAVFGGGRGTATYRDEPRSETYNVYDAYRECVKGEGNPSGDDVPVSLEAFRGWQ